MSRLQDDFRRSEKLVKAVKKAQTNRTSCPKSCSQCSYYRQDFKYRTCQFSRCIYGNRENVFRKKPLGRDKYSGSEVVSMHV